MTADPAINADDQDDVAGSVRGGRVRESVTGNGYADPDRSSAQAPILLFDGVCSLCHGTLRFVLARERAPVIRFGSLQSEVGRELLIRHGLDPDALESLVLIEGDRAYQKSVAALRLARFLRAPWSWAGLFRVVPRSIADWVYDRVASIRYRTFGKRESCELPTAGYGPERFLDPS